MTVRPQTHGLVPGAGEGEAGVRGETDVGDEVVVATERLLGNTKVLTVGWQVPDDGTLVYTPR